MLAARTVNPQPIADLLLDAPKSLWWQSRNGAQPGGGHGPHGDGWGITWRTGRRMLVKKSDKSADTDPEFKDFARSLQTDLFLAHVRRASPGMRVSLQNAHPFQEADLLLVHNGTIRRGLERRDDQTDSEAFLRWLSSRWTDRNSKTFVDILRDASKRFCYSALNFIMTDGNRLFAYRCCREDEKYYTLYYIVSDDRVVVTSEPVDLSKGWQLLKNETLLIVPDLCPLKPIVLELSL